MMPTAGEGGEPSGVGGDRTAGARTRFWGDDNDAERHLQGFLRSPQEEQTAFLDELAGVDLQMWDHLISTRVDWGNQRRVEIANTILCAGSRPFLGQVERMLPVLEPNVVTNHVARTNGTPGWKSTADLPLYGPSGAPDVLTDINAGTARNCDFHAALAAVALASPDLIKRHIRENVNGTFSVTLFREHGDVAPVTVTDRVPWSTSGYLNAKPGEPPSKWALIYEKAYAQLSGGYGLIEERDRSSLHALTGTAVTERSTDAGDLIELAGRLDAGEAMIATTWAFPSWVRNVEVQSMHVYALKSIDPRRSPPSVTLVSPEGRYSFVQPIMRLTQSDWLRYFATVRSASVSRR
jgi:Calpain family cysteine protease